MRDKQLAAKDIQLQLDKKGLLELWNIKEGNYKPHPYLVTDDHLDIIDKYFKGDRTEAAIELASDTKKCGEKGCELSYKEHTFDVALVLKAKKNMSEKSFKKEIIALKPLLEKHKIDGLAPILANGFKIGKYGGPIEETKKPV